MLRAGITWAMATKLNQALGLRVGLYHEKKQRSPTNIQPNIGRLYRRLPPKKTPTTRSPVGIQNQARKINANKHVEVRVRYTLTVFKSQEKLCLGIVLLLDYARLYHKSPTRQDSACWYMPGIVLLFDYARLIISRRQDDGWRRVLRKRWPFFGVFFFPQAQG